MFLPKILLNFPVRSLFMLAFVFLIVMTTVLLYMASFLNLKNIEPAIQDSFYQIAEEHIKRDLNITKGLFDAWLVDRLYKPK